MKITNNKSNLTFLFISSIIALFIGYLLIENQDKIDNESYEKSIELIQKNYNKNEEFKVKVYSNESINKILDEVEKQNKKIIKIENSTFYKSTTVTTEITIK